MVSVAAFVTEINFFDSQISPTDSRIAPQLEIIVLKPSFFFFFFPSSDTPLEDTEIMKCRSQRSQPFIPPCPV